MGKKAKEHRKKVAKRNQKIKQQKTGMQRAFDLLMQEQLNKLKEEDIKVQSQGESVNFEVVEDRVIENAFKFSPNEEESLKINEQFESNVSFKEQNPELMSINQTPLTEFEETERPIEYQISELEK
jgi:hypothetical protein